MEAGVPSGEHTKSYGKSAFFMGKSTISMAMFHCYVKLPEGIYHLEFHPHRGLFWTLAMAKDTTFPVRNFWVNLVKLLNDNLMHYVLRITFANNEDLFQDCQHPLVAWSKLPVPHGYRLDILQILEIHFHLSTMK